MQVNNNAPPVVTELIRCRDKPLYSQYSAYSKQAAVDQRRNHLCLQCAGIKHEIDGLFLLLMTIVVN